MGEINNIHVKWKVQLSPDFTYTLTSSMLCSKDIFTFYGVLGVVGCTLG